MIKKARKIAVFIVGSTVVLFGIALIVLPGPAVVVIPVGLAILATEFAWARRWLQIIRESAEKGAEKLNLRSFFSRKPINKKQDGDNPHRNPG
jgi:tellurite resistance protein TerC